MIELYFSPYERLLEVQQEYKKLWISYTPYIFTLITIILLQYFYKNNLTLLKILYIIHIIRIVSSLCMVYFAQLIIRKDVKLP